MTWQTYCNNYETLLKNNSDLTSIRQELFLAQNNSSLKNTIKSLIAFLKLIKYLLVPKKQIQKQEIDNIYFIDANTSANLGTLKPLYLKDDNSKLLIVNNKVETSPNFQDIKNNSLNLEECYFLYLKDIKNIFVESLMISKVLKVSFFNTFPLVVRYNFTKNSLNHVLSKLKTKNIFTSNDTLLASNLAIQLSKKYNITDYTLQHGFLTHFYVPTTATNYIVWGKKAKEWFENEKISSKILALGTPRLDEIEDIKKNAKKVKEEFYKSYQVDTKKKIFFYMSHSQAPEFGIEIHSQNFEALKEIVKNENYQLVIKLHPSESQNLFDEVFNNYKKNIILLPKDENLYHTIISSDICASAYSTTLIEAMCFDKPTLQMNMAKVEKLPDYSKTEGCISVESIAKLKDVISKEDFSMEIKRQNEYVEKYFENLGCTSEAILRYVGEKNAN